MCVDVASLVHHLEDLVARYDFDVIGLARRHGRPSYPLPTEPGTLGHLLESLGVRHLEAAVAGDSEAMTLLRGRARAYPDVELSGGVLGEQVVALDIKTARRKAVPKRSGVERTTQSRITLLTGNTYFANPSEPHPSILRPYCEYAAHLDWVMIFDVDERAEHPEVSGLEHIIAETWRIASQKRSSETRNYIGAVNSLNRLRSKQGDFSSQEEFEAFWRSHKGWRVSPPRTVGTVQSSFTLG